MYGRNGRLSLGAPRGPEGNSVWAKIIKNEIDLDRIGIHFSESFGKEVRDGETLFFEQQLVQRSIMNVTEAPSLSTRVRIISRREVTTPSLAIQFPILGLQGIILGFEPGCYSGKIPHMEAARIRTPDLPHIGPI